MNAGTKLNIAPPVIAPALMPARVGEGFVTLAMTVSQVTQEEAEVLRDAINRDADRLAELAGGYKVMLQKPVEVSKEVAQGWPDNPRTDVEPEIVRTQAEKDRAAEYMRDYRAGKRRR